MSLPEKPWFYVREIPDYLPVRVSLMWLYRRMATGELEWRGTRGKYQISRTSLVKILSHFSQPS